MMLSHRPLSSQIRRHDRWPPNVTRFMPGDESAGFIDVLSGPSLSARSRAENARATFTAEIIARAVRVVSHRCCGHLSTALLAGRLCLQLGAHVGTHALNPAKLG